MTKISEPNLERGTNNIQSVDYHVSDDEITLFELFDVIWTSKWKIFVITLVVSLGAAAITLTKPNIYKAEALLAPIEEARSGISSLAGQLGGLASLAGVSLGKGSVSEVTVALEVLKSRSFLTDFIERRELLIPLMAAKKWDATQDVLLIDPEQYDIENNRWVTDPSEVTAAVGPSEWKAFRAFSGLLQVDQDKITGLITVGIEHVSPVVAKQWVDWLIADINSHMRQRDIEEAQKSIDYLKVQLEQTSLAGMQEVFYQLIERQMQTIMLANVRDQYVFKLIDPPVIPEEKVGPKRALIVALSGMASAMICIFFFIARSVFRREPVSPINTNI